MKIVFMGTPYFASVALEKLYSEGFEIAAVFTQPDRPKNRGMKLSMSPVKELSLIHISGPGLRHVRRVYGSHVL